MATYVEQYTYLLAMYKSIFYIYNVYHTYIASVYTSVCVVCV